MSATVVREPAIHGSVVIDEASRVADDLYRAVRPMLAVSKGRLVALSTPFGQQGWFWSEWHGDGPWKRIQVTWHDCPRISAGFIADEERAMGKPWIQQEYECLFTALEGLVYPDFDQTATELVARSASRAAALPRLRLGPEHTLQFVEFARVSPARSRSGERRWMSRRPPAWRSPLRAARPRRWRSTSLPTWRMIASARKYSPAPAGGHGERAAATTTAALHGWLPKNESPGSRVSERMSTG